MGPWGARRRIRVSRRGKMKGEGRERGEGRAARWRRRGT
jgi:hypothetical protein